MDAQQRLREIQTAMDDNPSRLAMAGAVHDLAEILARQEARIDRLAVLVDEIAPGRVDDSAVRPRSGVRP